MHGSPVVDERRVELAPLARASADTFVAAAFESFHDELFAFLVRTTRDREVAEDLLQESFVRLVREVRAGRPPEQTRAWLYRVASNLAISRGRHSTVVRRVLDRFRGGDDAFETPEQQSVRREQLEDLEDALALLPADARAALVLAAHGFSGTEIAATLGRSHGATRTLLCRARVRVRLELEARGSGR